MASDDLLAQREKIQREILALESSLGADSSIIDLLSSDSNSGELTYCLLNTDFEHPITLTQNAV